MKPVTQKIKTTTIIFRVLLFSLICWFLTNGAAQSWWIGVPAVLLAMITSIALISPVTLVW